MDLEFAKHAASVKDDLIATRIARMGEITNLEKPNAPAQLYRGYRRTVTPSTT